MKLIVFLTIIACVQLASAADRIRDEEDTEALVKQAIKAAKAGETVTAINLLTESLEKRENGKAYVARAGLWFKLKKFDLVIQDCNRALQLAPRLPEAYLFRAMIKLEGGELTAAVADANRGADFSENDSTGALVSLFANVMSDNLAEALKEADRLVELEPCEADSFVMRGRVRHVAGNINGAKDDYKHALALNNDDVEAMYSIACLVFDQPESKPADYDNAIKIMERSCKLQIGKDDEWEQVALLAALHAKLGDYGKATELQGRVMKLAPVEELPEALDLLNAYKEKMARPRSSGS